MSTTKSTTVSTAATTSTSVRLSGVGDARSVKRPARPVSNTTRYGLIPLAHPLVKTNGTRSAISAPRMAVEGAVAVDDREAREELLAEPAGLAGPLDRSTVTDVW